MTEDRKDDRQEPGFSQAPRKPAESTETPAEGDAHPGQSSRDDWRVAEPRKRSFRSAEDRFGAPGGFSASVGPDNPSGPPAPEFRAPEFNPHSPPLRRAPVAPSRPAPMAPRRSPAADDAGRPPDAFEPMRPPEGEAPLDPRARQPAAPAPSVPDPRVERPLRFDSFPPGVEEPSAPPVEDRPHRPRRIDDFAPPAEEAAAPAPRSAEPQPAPPGVRRVAWDGDAAEDARARRAPLAAEPRRAAPLREEGVTAKSAPPPVDVDPERSAEEAADRAAFIDENSIGSLFIGARATAGKHDLVAVERDLRIKARYLQAIEGLDISALPKEAYLAGYVRSYARYLKDYLPLSPEEAYQKFRVELDAKIDELRAEPMEEPDPEPADAEVAEAPPPGPGEPGSDALGPPTPADILEMRDAAAAEPDAGEAFRHSAGFETVAEARARILADSKFRDPELEDSSEGVEVESAPPFVDDAPLTEEHARAPEEAAPRPETRAERFTAPRRPEPAPASARRHFDEPRAAPSSFEPRPAATSFEPRPAPPPPEAQPTPSSFESRPAPSSSEPRPAPSSFEPRERVASAPRRSEASERARADAPPADGGDAVKRAVERRIKSVRAASSGGERAAGGASMSRETMAARAEAIRAALKARKRLEAGGKSGVIRPGVQPAREPLINRLGPVATVATAVVVLVGLSYGAWSLLAAAQRVSVEAADRRLVVVERLDPLAASVDVRRPSAAAYEAGGVLASPADAPARAAAPAAGLDEAELDAFSAELQAALAVDAGAPPPETAFDPRASGARAVFDLYDRSRAGAASAPAAIPDYGVRATAPVLADIRDASGGLVFSGALNDGAMIALDPAAGPHIIRLSDASAASMIVDGDGFGPIGPGPSPIEATIGLDEALALPADVALSATLATEAVE